MAISQDKVQELLDLIKKLNEKVEAIKNEKINIKLKDDNTPVTKADLLVNDELIKFIKTTQYTKIISEENRQLDFSERTNWEWYWVVDPIDGTKEFIKKGEDYTINIALCHKERPVFSVVSRPSNGDIYYAIKDKGAFKNNKRIYSDGNQKVIKVIASKTHLNSMTENFINNLSKSVNFETLNVGSSLKICFISEGLAQIYPRFGTTMEWDTAAADLILFEAGGEMIGCKSFNALSYNKEDLRNEFFLCYSKSLSKEKRKLICQLAKENVV